MPRKTKRQRTSQTSGKKTRSDSVTPASTLSTPADEQVSIPAANSDCTAVQPTVAASPAKRRGRPSKRQSVECTDAVEETVVSATSDGPAKRTRGTTAKVQSEPVISGGDNDNNSNNVQATDCIFVTPTVAASPARRRGRPAKTRSVDSKDSVEETVIFATPDSGVSGSTSPAKRRRGRPRKVQSEPIINSANDSHHVGAINTDTVVFDSPAKRGRGRPRRSQSVEVNRPNVAERVCVVVLGSFHQASEGIFTAAASGKQCTACATMAVAYKNFTEAEAWMQDTVDSVLRYGDALYRKSILSRIQPQVRQGEQPIEYLSVDEVHSRFIVDTRGIEITFDMGQSIDGFLGEGAIDLKDALIRFITNHSDGVVVCDGTSRAILKYDFNTFSVFDSHSCNENGVSSANGAACYIRYSTADDVATHISEIYSSTVAITRFSIFPITAVITDELVGFEEGDRLTTTTVEQPNAQTDQGSISTRLRSRGVARSEIEEGYDEHGCFILGSMTKKCSHCDALFFRCENIGSLCCQHGAIALGTEQTLDYPELLKALLTDCHPKSKDFTNKVRAYNSNVAFASVKMNREHPQGRGRPVIVISGMVYHFIGPVDERDPKFGTMYFCEPDVANAQRQVNQSNRGDVSASDRLDLNLLAQIDSVLRNVNPYAKVYEGMRHMLNDYRRQNPDRVPNMEIRFHTNVPNLDRGRYNRPTSEHEVGAAFVSVDGEVPLPGTLIVYHTNNNNGDDNVGQRQPQRLKEISKISDLADPLCYPILFPRGEQGWTGDIPTLPTRERRRRTRVSMREFYSYHLMEREGVFNPRLRAGKLTQQFIIDAYTKVEGDRLNFLRSNQQQIRADTYAGLQDYVARRAEAIGGADAMGRLVILPDSFTGGRRYMVNCYQDAMAMVCKFGTPSLFLTMTCNPNWPEIVSQLGPHLTAQDRPDIVSRVFRAKFRKFRQKVIDDKFFGEVVSWMYVIEFQKRGLPHAHVLITLRPEDKIREPQQVDRFISAEIPDEQENPRLFELVTRTMIHGPCGERNPQSPCMEKGKCTKKYPKEFAERTVLTVGRQPTYRRRCQDGRKVQIKVGNKVYKVDNRDVVPYNPTLTTIFDCHLNVVLVTDVGNVKYLFKYVTKGSDAAVITVEAADENPNEFVFDEIKEFQDTRYLSPGEAVYRLYKFEIVEMSHTVTRLIVHLQGESPIYFRQGEEEAALDRAGPRLSTLEAFFALNDTEEEARQFLYTEVPLHYIFKESKWKKRQYSSRNVISRMYTISPRWIEKFHMRILLLHVRGPRSFEDLRTVDGVLCATFKEAADRRLLTATDEEWVRTLRDAAAKDMPRQMRKLFCYLLCYAEVNAPATLWNDFQNHMIEDYERRGMNREEAKRRALIEIENFLWYLGRHLEEFEIEPPVRLPGDVDDYVQITDGGDIGEGDVVVIDDNDAFRDDPPDAVMNAVGNAAEEAIRLSPEQAVALRAIESAVYDPERADRYFYLQGCAGTGKTFLYNTILSRMEASGVPAVAVAFTGIAALLLKGGRTSHSTFMIPLNLDADSTSYMYAQSQQAVRLRGVRLIVWDEISMTDCRALDVVDKLMKFLKGDDRPFGGVCTLLGGDIRQLLPVDPVRMRQQEKCFVNCTSWRHFQVLHLTVNQRTDPEEREFADWLLTMGNGTCRPDADTMLANANIPWDSIVVPAQCLVDDAVSAIYGPVYDPDIDFTDRAILCPKNDQCDHVNLRLTNRFPGDEKIFLSIDSMVTDDEEERANFTEEYLNSLKLSGLPNHKLVVKVGVPLMLLRNLSVADGLTNGTRLILREFTDHLLTAEIATGVHRGETVLIPRMDLTSTPSAFPIVIKRRQFPVKVCFAMTINKSQGQTFEHLGIFLPTPVFAHGQLYVAFSRARRWSAVKVQVCNTNEQGQLLGRRDTPIFTRNVVYREMLRIVFGDYPS